MSNLNASAIDKMTVQELVDELKKLPIYLSLSDYAVKKAIGGNKPATKIQLQNRLIVLIEESNKLKKSLNGDVEKSIKSKKMPSNNIDVRSSTTKKLISEKNTKSNNGQTKPLRLPQKNCLDNVRNHFQIDHKGLIKMFCGSGKSRVIYEVVLKYGYSLAVIIVPSINLITQFSREYPFDIKYKTLTVCSKDELKQNNHFTTDADDISKFVISSGNKIILITKLVIKGLYNIYRHYLAYFHYNKGKKI